MRPDKSSRLRRVVIVAALLATGAASAEAVKPQDVATAFCQAYLDKNTGAMRALFTPSLANEVAAAEKRSKAIAEATPDLNAPFAAGIPFQSFPDPAPVCEPGDVSQAGQRIEIELMYTHPDGSASNWTDRLKLVDEGGRLLIDDIVFADVANGTPDMTLRRVLIEAFDY